MYSALSSSQAFKVLPSWVQYDTRKIMIIRFSEKLYPVHWYFGRKFKAERIASVFRELEYLKIVA
jgi:hypothetical protein